jgi:hypothetical protein
MLSGRIDSAVNAKAIDSLDMASSIVVDADEKNEAGDVPPSPELQADETKARPRKLVEDEEISEGSVPIKVPSLYTTRLSSLTMRRSTPPTSPPPDGGSGSLFSGC